jgi:sulfatase modifying factor 1
VARTDAATVRQPVGALFDLALMTGCCAPSSGRPGDNVPRHQDVQRGDGTPLPIELDGGLFLMGSEGKSAYPDDGEGPLHEVELEPFRIDPFTLSNARFADFVADTAFVTDAERFGWSFVFAGFLPDDFPETRAAVDAPWWRQVFGADWRHPEGPHSTIDDRWDHPVVHVSWTDAQAFCTWSGTRLPTEAEWEYAAAGGSSSTAFPWGDELEPGGRHLMNVFQGTFPAGNNMADGWAGTAPVDSFPPNGYGLYNMTGNVWEWCADWFDPAFYARGARQNPTGPTNGTHRVMRGGSYLCHESYCRRYRVSARSANTPDSSTGNLGFRVVADTVTS